ncbi:MAG: ferrous iron transport protein B [Epsilonproteobacteria bacterium]|nr:ferrous iron transport protein B [Campylobacterota bacterium]
MNNINVVLVGQPNVGKSMLINALSKSHLKVGNFSGVTVEKTEVDFQYCDEKSCSDYNIHIVDLPGAYSLTEYTIEEKVTKNYLQEADFDVIVNVIDSTNLERNLLLTSQLLDLGKRVVIALNMSDEADKEGIDIDVKQLSAILGIPCIKTSAAENTGIETLKEAIVTLYTDSTHDAKMVYSDTIEEEIEKIVFFLKMKKYKSEVTHKKLAVKLLQEDSKTYKKMHEEPIWIELLPIVRDSLNHIYLHYGTKDLEEIFEDERMAYARGAALEVQSVKSTPKESLTQKIDSLLIHKFFGVPIFLFFMWLLFQLTFEIGSIPMDLIDTFFAALSAAAINTFGDGQIGSIIADGMIAGVGAVVMFLPNIMILFLGIALLETTGYMSRVAFLLDGFFHKFGLHGKSFIPLVTGFGCSVPAYMAARTLKNEKDRLLTLFIIGFMSCGARLPIYVLFTGAFFTADQAGNVLFLIYISGALLGLIAAKVLNVVVFKNEDEPFVMEMPKYRMPSLALIWHTVWNNAWMYLKKAGTFILAASILIWFASNYPKYPELEKQYQTKIEILADESEKNALQNELQMKLLEQSYLGIVGKATEPLFAPLGFDWRMTVALETGLAAKEVVVSTLGVLYALGDEVDEEHGGLVEKIKENIPFAAAIAFIVFVMIYLPCLAASMVFVKEAGGWKYLAYLFVFTTATAWILSFIAYRIALGVVG